MLKFFLTIRSILVFQFFLIWAVGHVAYGMQTVESNEGASVPKPPSAPKQGKSKRKPSGMHMLSAKEALQLAEKALGGSAADDLGRRMKVSSAVIIVSRINPVTGVEEFLWELRKKESKKGELFSGLGLISGGMDERDKNKKGKKDIKITAQREAREEMGIEIINSDKLEFVCNYVEPVGIPMPGGGSVGLGSMQACYYAKDGTWKDAEGTVNGDVFKLNENEVEGYIWLTMTDFFNRKMSNHAPLNTSNPETARFSSLGHDDLFLNEFMLKFKKNSEEESKKLKKEEKKRTKEQRRALRAQKTAAACLAAKLEAYKEAFGKLADTKCSPSLEIRFVREELSIQHDGFIAEPQALQQLSILSPSSSPSNDPLSGKGSSSDNSPVNSTKRPSFSDPEESTIFKDNKEDSTEITPDTSDTGSESESELEMIVRCLSAGGSTHSLGGSMEFTMEPIAQE